MVVVSSTFCAPSDGVLFSKPSIKLIVNDTELGVGHLYITEEFVVWGGGTLTAGGDTPTLTFLYPTISLHGLQKEPTPALFMVINYELKLPALGNMSNEEDEYFDPDDVPVTQLRFVPECENDVNGMYMAMCQGQALHPDPEPEGDEHFFMDEGETDDDMFEDAEESDPQSDDPSQRLRQLNLENSNGVPEVNGQDDGEE